MCVGNPFHEVAQLRSKVLETHARVVTFYRVIGFWRRSYWAQVAANYECAQGVQWALGGDG